MNRQCAVSAKMNCTENQQVKGSGYCPLFRGHTSVWDHTWCVWFFNSIVQWRATKMIKSAWKCKERLRELDVFSLKKRRLRGVYAYVKEKYRRYTSDCHQRWTPTAQEVIAASWKTQNSKQIISKLPQVQIHRKE